MELMDVLARTPEFASNCSAGQKIWEIICQWDNFTDFDQEYFYHARAMADNGCPFTSLEMGKLPILAYRWADLFMWDRDTIIFLTRRKGPE